jgi:predicted TIM-barrel fold metal-dependent hydrolase
VLPDAVVRRFPGGDHPRYVTAEGRVLARMLAAHEAHGVTHALVSDSFFMEVAAEALPAWTPRDRARLFNDELARLVSRHPGRLFGLGCVDPFDGESAARELERMKGELGLVGALVAPSDGRRYLDDPVVAPLLAAAARIGAPLFVHPTRDLPAGEHYADFVMSLMIGRPAQTSVCAARLILTGALDRHPALKLLLAHGAGVLPYVAGRLDAIWQDYRAEGRWRGVDVLTAPPSTYLRRFHADSNTWSAAALALLVETLGPDRVVFGTDQPPVWVPLERSIDLLDALPGGDAVTRAVRAGNAERLFGLRLAGAPRPHPD